MIGSIANVVSPGRIPWMRDWEQYVSGQATQSGMHVVSLGETRSIVSAGKHIIFDARPFADYGVGHIPGAVSLPSADLETAFENFRMLLSPELPILVYCSGQQCDESLQLGEFLMAEGFTNIVLYPGGYDEWQAGDQE
jgi:rhodanese-related sulfurtransferase